jgi:hypothetical protein
MTNMILETAETRFLENVCIDWPAGFMHEETFQEKQEIRNRRFGSRGIVPEMVVLAASVPFWFPRRP